jgi:hypothetical protein
MYGIKFNISQAVFEKRDITLFGAAGGHTVTFLKIHLSIFIH